MEVDDAAMVSGDTPVGHAASPRWLAENGGARTASHIGRRNDTKATATADNVGDPPELEPPPEQNTGEIHSDDKNEDDSLYSESALKLEVSGTEDEDSRDGGASVSQTLTASSADKEMMKINAINVSLKRKRYEIRSSGSNECLLGFDEKSGEAKLVKAEFASFSKESEENVVHESPDNSPRPSKKIKHKSGETSPSLASPKSQQSPKISQVDTINIEKKSKKEELSLEQRSEHIVADTEEIESKTEADPQISSLSNSGTQVGNSVSKKPLSAQDDFYKKPFEYGWKRELVWRANMESSKDKADVYFITPGGKKLRTRGDIIPLLEGDLTIDNFSFVREPLGVGSEFEIVRSAKPSGRASASATALAAAPTPTNIGKRISKPKGPKGASPPPQGWTPTRALKVNNALLSGNASSRYTSHGTPGTPPSSRHASSSSGASHKSAKTKKGSVSTSVTVTTANASAGPANNLNSRSTLEPCTIKCSRASGQVPQLKCFKCLCLFHHECVGLSRSSSEYCIAGEGGALSKGREYFCEACVPVSEASSGTKLATTRKPTIGRPIRLENKYPQTIAVVKGKKYVMVAKPIAPPTEHVNDIENDLKQINESIRNNRKTSAASLDAPVLAHSIPAAQTTVDQSNKVFATNFFANVSFAYDALLCILKYLKIHERPRAASVCKLWHLAAKDTSLWQTVRMKNSRVSSWAGFAAALRRGETKHLDLRKMLVSSTRGEEMWQDFSEHIGTVCSLEIIDLCRCSARIVESLFQSNKNLRILNAVAINDDSISLEHIGMLTRLEELRLRTCEPGVITGNLQSLQALVKLNQLSLTSVRELGSKGVEVIGELVNLRSLELGECGDFDPTFAKVVLPKLKNLRRLRLENGQETNCCTLEILDAVAQLEELSQLELVNFDIKSGFDEKLQLCTNIRKLLIIPTYISQSATTNHIVLNAVQQVASTLKVFTWGVTVELLRVTALYVDQCEESTKKEKHHFDECIPVLKPVPGAPAADDEDEDDEERENARDESVLSDVPQIEILPLDKVESILGDNLPKTKFTIVKVPYHATCKQQLVE
ncbi:uncharacterized protein LOC118748406 isoform X1 [Rhagoletis pomonella]|uniref:uncharacterized protein LOC118748406 isoform X1 n=1 Tax=Rhagoletis pomonella TaxID=28610 RepID=UPI001783980C|nr:uncharacterized protein LOC118748406 isoform X1 [Rhagoletis pomonella]XP_036338686.1 uncharacterized protein LOC118748406 isoform X1 [Rhagoletis pomonella]